MANHQNLTHKLTAEEQRAGGKKSVQVRREKKQIKTLLDEFLESDIKDYPKLKTMANKIGISDEENIKKLFTIMCAINTLKKGNITELVQVAEFLGETEKDKNTDIIKKLDSVLDEIKGNI